MRPSTSQEASDDCELSWISLASGDGKTPMDLVPISNRIELLSPHRRGIFGSSGPPRAGHQAYEVG